MSPRSGIALAMGSVAVVAGRILGCRLAAFIRASRIVLRNSILNSQGTVLIQVPFNQKGKENKIMELTPALRKMLITLIKKKKAVVYHGSEKI